MRTVLGTAILAAGLGGVVGAQGAAPATRAIVTSRPATAAQSALHDRIVDEYMKGDWGPLAGDLTKGTQELTALPKDLEADILYIKQAVAECRPVWWDQVKTGNRVVFTSKVWDRPLVIAFDPSYPVGGVAVARRAGNPRAIIHWSTVDMDSAVPDEHGFTKGDLASIDVWSALELVEIRVRVDEIVRAAMNKSRDKQFDDFLTFRGLITATYYGTPRAREWAFFLACDAYQNGHSDSARKPLAAMLMAELVGHPERYPSLRFSASLPTEHVEQQLAAELMRQFEKPLTFGEDKALRDAVKVLAHNNWMGTFDSGKVTLANRLEIMLDPAKDGDAASKRDTWLRAQLSASVPTTKP